MKNNNLFPFIKSQMFKAGKFLSILWMLNLVSINCLAYVGWWNDGNSDYSSSSSSSSWDSNYSSGSNQTRRPTYREYGPDISSGYNYLDKKKLQSSTLKLDYLPYIKTFVSSGIISSTHISNQEGALQNFGLAINEECLDYIQYQLSLYAVSNIWDQINFLNLSYESQSTYEIDSGSDSFVLPLTSIVVQWGSELSETTVGSSIYESKGSLQKFKCEAKLTPIKTTSSISPN